MPRNIKEQNGKHARHPGLVKELAGELEAAHSSGQPRVEEEHFARTNFIKVSVLWDKWEKVPDDERGLVILDAYEKSEGKDYRDRIALPIGLTFPEAFNLGLLPVRLFPVVRSEDKVSLQDSYRAMKEEGASLLFDARVPELRFGTEEEAEDCKADLSKNCSKAVRSGRST